MSVLATSKVRYTYPGRLPISFPDFLLEAGDVAALVGPSGSGKSTLLMLIAGRHAQIAWAEHQAATRPIPSSGAPNVLFIVLDTVRARSLSLYGYHRPTTPRPLSAPRSSAR